MKCEVLTLSCIYVMTLCCRRR